MIYDFFSHAGNVFFFLKLLIGFSLLISSIQHIINRNMFGQSGILAWPMVKKRRQFKRFNGQIFDAIYNENGFVILNSLKFILTILFIILPFNFFTIFGLTIVTLLIYFRAGLVGNAADQVINIVLTGLLISKIFAVFNPPAIIIFFFAGVLIISYFTSGVLKIYEPKWRNGYYLKRILIVRSYDNRFLLKITSFENIKIYKILSQTVIYWQLSSVITPFLPPSILIVYLSIGLSFHVFTGILLGLNNFIWTFSALLPTIIFLNFTVLNAI